MCNVFFFFFYIDSVYYQRIFVIFLLRPVRPGLCRFSFNLHVNEMNLCRTLAKMERGEKARHTQKKSKKIDNKADGIGRKSLKGFIRSEVKKFK